MKFLKYIFYMFVDDDDDDDSAFSSGPKFQRAISINLKSLISATDSPPSSPGSHGITPHSSPVTSPLTKLAISSVTPSAATNVTSTTPITKSALPLVDYPDEDSDEDFDGEGMSPAKRSRVGST